MLVDWMHSEPAKNQQVSNDARVAHWGLKKEKSADNLQAAF